MLDNQNGIITLTITQGVYAGWILEDDEGHTLGGFSRKTELLGFLSNQLPDDVQISGDVNADVIISGPSDIEFSFLEDDKDADIGPLKGVSDATQQCEDASDIETRAAEEPEVAPEILSDEELETIKPPLKKGVFSADEMVTLQQLLDDGLSVKDIAAKMNRYYIAVYQKIKSANLPAVKVKPVAELVEPALKTGLFSDDETDVLIKMLDGGHSIPEIATALNRKELSVRDKIKNSDFEMPENLPAPVIPGPALRADVVDPKKVTNIYEIDLIEGNIKLLIDASKGIDWALIAKNQGITSDEAVLRFKTMIPNPSINAIPEKIKELRRKIDRLQAVAS